MAVQQLRNERRPLKPLQPWTQPPDTFRYKVQTGDTWLTLAARNNHQFGEHTLIWLNFRLSPLDRFYTDQVNWYLREYVGCRHSHDGGRNWAFTDDADPGYIFLPNLTYNMDAIAITGRVGVGGVSAPVYSDKNAYDTISKALDIYSVADMGISMSQIPLAALIEGGMIATGAIAAITGPFVALGAPYNDALKSKTRQHFFGGFFLFDIRHDCRRLVCQDRERLLSAVSFPASRHFLSREARDVPSTLQFRTQGRAAAGLAAEYGGPEKPLHPASLSPYRR
ncbi:hypothetical protein ACFFWD_43215 [Bradyrhizobium erythrophlei]|uniref:hypothetical protein n=1 Tax=Bradyrhizobium erythrophlei TaxID=1437360 RepID=UPI0035E76C1A